MWGGSWRAGLQTQFGTHKVTAFCMGVASSWKCRNMGCHWKKNSWNAQKHMTISWIQRTTNFACTPQSARWHGLGCLKKEWVVLTHKEHCCLNVKQCTTTSLPALFPAAKPVPGKWLCLSHVRCHGKLAAVRDDLQPIAVWLSRIVSFTINQFEVHSLTIQSLCSCLVDTAQWTLTYSLQRTFILPDLVPSPFYLCWCSSRYY